MSVVALKYNICPGDRVELSVDYWLATGRRQDWGTYPQVCSYRNLQQVSAAIMADLEAGRSAIGSCTTPVDLRAAEPALESLRGRCRRLAECLLADAVKEKLGADPSVTHLIFEYDPLMNGVPFDCMFLWDDFAGYRYATGRLLRSHKQLQQATRQPAGLPYRGYGIVNPDGTLKEVAAAYASFYGAWITGPSRKQIDFSRVCAPGGTTPDDIVSAWSNHDFVNVICHHEYNGADPQKSGYVLQAAAGGGLPGVFAAKELLNLGAGCLPPFLVFSIACESGITRGWEASWPDDRLYGMVDVALRIGIRHYIGSIIEIPATRSPDVLKPFYDALSEGYSVGEALRQARLAFRRARQNPLDGGTILGLAFVLYGAPEDGYFCAGGHRTDASTIVLCGQMDGSRPCGCVACANDAGFTKRLCDRHYRGEPITCSAGHTVAGAANLAVCSGNDGKCRNTICPKCSGWGQQLCWEHCCANKHPIVAGALKECRDPTGLHRGHNRSVCPRDPGWMDGLCDQCDAAAHTAARQQESCPHCGRFITPKNSWFGVCSDCGDRTCSGQDCGPWHASTMCCPKADDVRSAADKEAGWINAVNKRGTEDRTLAGVPRLRESLAGVQIFQDNVAINLQQQMGLGHPMPRLLPSLCQFLGLPGPVLKVAVSAADLSGELVASLIQRCGLPASPHNGQLWEPPKAWQDELQKVNQLRIHLVKGIGVRPVIIAVATLAPVEFLSMKGPVLVPCDADHLERVRTTVERWWQGVRHGGMPDVYVVALAITGWSDTVRPSLATGCLTMLAEERGNTWDMRIPPLDGMPAGVRSCARMLAPVTVFDERSRIRQWIVKYLGAWDQVDVLKVQDELQQEDESEREHAAAVDTGNVKAVFRDLADSSGYTLTEIDGRRVLRPATRSERGRQIVRRRWVEIATWIICAAGMSLIWLAQRPLGRILPDHWVGRAIASAILFAVCNAFMYVVGRVALGRTRSRV
jgi:hypothetical protein